MDADEIRAIDKRLAAMSERCDYVISRNRPLTLDTPPRRKAKVVMPHETGSRLESQSNYNAEPRSLGGGVAFGPLTGNEMRRPSGYSSRPRDCDDCNDSDPNGMWARFEIEFDEMVQAHRG